MALSVGAQRWVSQGYGPAVQQANKTFAALHQIPETATAIAFEILNSLPDTPSIYNAAFAVSAGISDRFTPINGDGVPDDTLWTPITYQGKRDIVVPTAPNSELASRILTDTMHIARKPQRRVDGGSGLCVFFRIFALHGAVTFQWFDGTVKASSSTVNGHDLSQFSTTLGGGWGGFTNRCTTGTFPTTFHAPNLANILVPHAVLPIFDDRECLTVMSIGDSILSGVSSRGKIDIGVSGVGLHLAKFLDCEACPAFHLNEATSGTGARTFLANGLASLKLIRTDVMLLQTFSANDEDAIKPSVALAMYKSALLVAHYARAHGAFVILVTAPPFSGSASARTSSKWETTRTWANGLIYETDFAILDVDAILGSSVDPVNYSPSYSDDCIHPNDFGAWQLARTAFCIIQRHKTSAPVFPNV